MPADRVPADPVPAGRVPTIPEPASVVAARQLADEAHVRRRAVLPAAGARRRLRAHTPAIRRETYGPTVRVLIVEDELYLAAAVRDGLRLEAIAADVVGDGDAALSAAAVNC